MKLFAFIFDGPVFMGRGIVVAKDEEEARDLIYEQNYSDGLELREISLHEPGVQILWDGDI